MSAAKRVAHAAETVRARWERQVSTDPQTEAAQALEDTGQLLDPEVAAELVAFRKARELAEAVAEHGALPMPVGPQSQALSAARLAEAEERAAHLYEFGNDVPADEWNRLAGDDVPVLVAEIRRQAAVIAELNESVSTAAEALRARPSCPCPPEGRPHQVGCPQAEVPASERPVNGLTATFASVAALREVADGEHYAHVHHSYLKGHDLEMPGTGGAL